MGIKYPGLLLVFLLPALIGIASGAIYIENATVFNFSLNTTTTELNSSIYSVQPRIFTEHIDSILDPSLTTPSLELNNSLNAVRPRIFTEHIDSIFDPSLTTPSLELNNSLNTVRLRIFTEHIDSILGQSLTTPSLELNNSLNTVRPRIFTEHIDSIFDPSLTTPSLELNNSLNTVRSRIFTEHIDSILIRQLNVTSPELDNSISKVKPRIFIESADMLWFTPLINMTPDPTIPDSITNLHETGVGPTWINWTWDNPNNTDFGHVIISINGNWKANTSANYFDATGLNLDTTYEIAIKTADIWGNVNESSVTDTARTLGYIPDISPPNSINDLQNTTYAPNYINWIWINPSDTDFSHVMVYLNGIYQRNVTAPANFYNTTDVNPDTKYIISTHTVDTSGNVNDTWVNDTASTLIDLQILDLLPENGSRLGSNTVQFSWRTSFNGTTDVYIKSQDETNYTRYVGDNDTFHSVMIDNLTRNKWYYYYVSSGSATSENRSFYIDNGIEFSQKSYNFTIERDYSQLVSVSVRNMDSNPHSLLVSTYNPYNDLIFGFIGNGSQDQEIMLNPGENKDITLSIFAQDAMLSDYRLQITLNATDSNVFDYAMINLKIRQPNINYTVTEIAADPYTLTKTFRVTNNGDRITDFSIFTEGALANKVLFKPAISHANIGSGESFTFKLVPLIESDAPITGFINATGAEKSKTIEVNFSQSGGKILYTSELSNVTICMGTNSWYCTNNPYITNTLYLPPGFDSADVKAAVLAINFSLPWNGADYRNHNVNISLNDHPVKSLINTIPNGLYLIPIDPSYLNYGLNGAGANQINIDTAHLNGGHYVVATNIELRLKLNKLTTKLFADSQDQADIIAKNMDFLCDKCVPKTEIASIEAIPSSRQLTVATNQNVTFNLSLKLKNIEGGVLQIEVYKGNSLITKSFKDMAGSPDTLENFTLSFQAPDAAGAYDYKILARFKEGVSGELMGDNFCDVRDQITYIINVGIPKSPFGRTQVQYTSLKGQPFILTSFDYNNPSQSDYMVVVSPLLAQAFVAEEIGDQNTVNEKVKQTEDALLAVRSVHPNAYFYFIDKDMGYESNVDKLRADTYGLPFVYYKGPEIIPGFSYLDPDNGPIKSLKEITNPTANIKPTDEIWKEYGNKVLLKINSLRPHYLFILGSAKEFPEYKIHEPPYLILEDYYIFSDKYYAQYTKNIFQTELISVGRLPIENSKDYFDAKKSFSKNAYIHSMDKISTRTDLIDTLINPTIKTLTNKELNKNLVEKTLNSKPYYIDDFLNGKPNGKSEEYKVHYTIAKETNDLTMNIDLTDYSIFVAGWHGTTRRITPKGSGILTLNNVHPLIFIGIPCLISNTGDYKGNTLGASSDMFSSREILSKNATLVGNTMFGHPKSAEIDNTFIRNLIQTRTVGDAWLETMRDYSFVILRDTGYVRDIFRLLGDPALDTSALDDPLYNDVTSLPTHFSITVNTSYNETLINGSSLLGINLSSNSSHNITYFLSKDQFATGSGSPMIPIIYIDIPMPINQTIDKVSVVYGDSYNENINLTKYVSILLKPDGAEVIPGIEIHGDYPPMNFTYSLISIPNERMLKIEAIPVKYDIDSQLVELYKSINITVSTKPFVEENITARVHIAPSLDYLALHQNENASLILSLYNDYSATENATNISVTANIPDVFNIISTDGAIIGHTVSWEFNNLTINGVNSFRSVELVIQAPANITELAVNQINFTAKYSNESGGVYEPTEVPIQVSLIPLDYVDLNASNMVIDSPLKVGTPVNVTAIISNDGHLGVTYVPVKLLVDGNESSEQIFNLPAKEIRYINFTITGLEGGKHQISIIVEPISLETNITNNIVSENVNIYYDIIPPASIEDLNTKDIGTTWLNFTWLNPADPDFSHVMLFLNGTFKISIPAPQNYYNFTGLNPDALYELRTHTVDSSGNVNETWVNATAKTASISGTTYSISLKSGWNLISAPLNLTTWELGNETEVGDSLNVTPRNCISSIYRYNTTSKSFEKSDHFDNWGWYPATGSESFTKLEPGRGYWVMAQQNCSLTFTGTAPSDLDIPIDSGWNLIGWYSTNDVALGEEAVDGNPLNVAPKNSLTSIYRYNITSGSFEKSDHFDDWGWYPATGSESFTKLEMGRGYWVMVQNEAVWNCSLG